MACGVQILDASGVLIWDSTTVVGGVFIDTRSFSSTTTATLTYPALAGLTPSVTPHTPQGTAGVTVDTSLGYPRVTVATGPRTRNFSVMVE
jgi:hypothetical protein